LASSSTPIADALKHLRGRITLDDMAPKVAVGRSSLVRYESGERLPDQDFLAAFAEATGADFLDLLRLRLASSPDEPAQRMASQLGRRKSPARERAEQLEEDRGGYESLIQAQRAIGAVGIAASSGVMHMAMTQGQGEPALQEVDAALLAGCLDACVAVHGVAFQDLTASEQVMYAVELYNLLVRMTQATRKSGDPLRALQRLESAGLADQLRLLVKMGMARQVPPPGTPALV